LVGEREGEGWGGEMGMGIRERRKSGKIRINVENL
jgi:hypothetical protein